MEYRYKRTEASEPKIDFQKLKEIYNKPEPMGIIEVCKAVKRWVKIIFRKKKGSIVTDKPVYYRHDPYFEKYNKGASEGGTEYDEDELKEILEDEAQEIREKYYTGIDKRFWGIDHDEVIDERLQEVIEKLEDDDI